jgi:hypothetical protein
VFHICSYGFLFLKRESRPEHYSTIRSFGFPSLRGGASVEDVSPNTSLVLAIVGRGFFFNLAGRDLGQRGAFGL